MPVVATGLLSAPVPGVWRRLSLISSDGSLNGLREERLVGQLEELGIPRHQLGLAHQLLNWQRAQVPPDVALALWLLRQHWQTHGCLYRRASVPVEESSSAIRYIQLAAAVGETLETDPTLAQVVTWLLDRQLPDGSIPLIVAAGQGETGQTGRSLRVLSRLHAPDLTEPLERMRAYLEDIAIPQEPGVGWANYGRQPPVVTGSTALAVLALIEQGVGGDVVRGGLRYLLAAQDQTGGWAEVPGYTPAMQNTFNGVRALKAGHNAGLLDSDPAPALQAARTWFENTIRSQTPRETVDLAFAVRLATQLGLLPTKRVERLGQRLAKRRRQTLSPTADTYAETEITALALLEASQSLDTHAKTQRWNWRWALPEIPPPFLCREAYFYEVLYSAFKARWWVRAVDTLVQGGLVERMAGLLLGAIVTLGIIDEQLSAAFAVPHLDGRRILAVVIVATLLLLWSGVKLAARAAVSGATWTSLAALVVAVALTWILPTPNGASLFPALLPVVALRWLIIDIVAFTADRSHLLERFLPK